MTDEALNNKQLGFPGLGRMPCTATQYRATYVVDHWHFAFTTPTSENSEMASFPCLPQQHGLVSGSGTKVAVHIMIEHIKTDPTFSDNYFNPNGNGQCAGPKTTG